MSIESRSLRAIREYFKYSIEDIAKELMISIEEAQAMEAPGFKVERDHLIDLAVLYGTSTLDLEGNSPLFESLTTNSYGHGDDEDVEGFWGNIGILLPKETHSRWFPITWREVGRIKDFMENFDRSAPWLVIPTLNNRVILLNFDAAQNVYLLDDGADQMEGDWKLTWDGYSGHPGEIYRGLSNIYHSEEIEGSERFTTTIENLIAKHGEAENFWDSIVNTIVHYRDERKQRFAGDDDLLWSLYQSVEDDQSPTVFDVSRPSEGLCAYAQAASVAMIEMPLHQVCLGALNERGHDQKIRKMIAETE